jgi:hypothetical protein
LNDLICASPVRPDWPSFGPLSGPFTLGIRDLKVKDLIAGSLGAWLAVIARNRAIDALRKRRYESDIENIVVSVEPDLASEADRSRAAKNVRDVLNVMHAAQR